MDQKLSLRTRAEMECGRRMVAINKAADHVDKIRDMFFRADDLANRFFWVSSNMKEGVVILEVGLPDGTILNFAEPLFDFPTPKLMAQLKLIAPA